MTTYQENVWYPDNNEQWWIADLGINENWPPVAPPLDIMPPFEVTSEIDYFLVDSATDLNYYIDGNRYPNGADYYTYWRNNDHTSVVQGVYRDYSPYNDLPQRLLIVWYPSDYAWPAPPPPNEPAFYCPGLVSHKVRVHEAVGAGMDIAELKAHDYVHLLSSDTHSQQMDVGYAAGLLSVASPYSYERWLRVSVAGKYQFAGDFSFWVPNYEAAPGWDIRYGVAENYRAPISTVSPIATQELLTDVPITPNVSSGLGYGPAETTSFWVVLQARVTDFSLVASGPYGGPTMLRYNFGWIEA